METIAPHRAILDFIGKLPEPLRANFQTVVSLPFCVEPLRPNTDFGEIFNTLFDRIVGVPLVQRIVQVIALIDFHFARPADTFERMFENMPAEAKESEILRAMALQAPLRRKYLERAAADWQTLRQSSLTYEALRAFEATQMVATLRMLQGK